MRYGARGPSYATTSACASGAHAIGDAVLHIRDGRQDVILAGGAEAPVCLLGIGGFIAMRALATGFNDDPGAREPPLRSRPRGLRGRGGRRHARAGGPRPRPGAGRAHPGRDRRLRHQLRRLPHDAALARGRGSGRVHGAGAHGCGCRAGRGRLRQRARHRHALQRRRRDPGHQARVRRAGRASRGELDEVDDRPSAGCLGRRRGDLHRAGRVSAASCRRRSTSTTPTRSATSTTCAHTARRTNVEVALSNSFGFGGTNVSLAVRQAS